MNRDSAGFSFDAGRLALDLMATMSGHGSDSPIERLTDPARLACWLRKAGLVSRSVVVTAADLRETRSLRDALFDVVGAVMRHDRVSSTAVEVLNHVAAQPVPASQLVIDTGEVRRHGPELDATTARAVIARDGIDLLGDPDRMLLRECEADDCSGVYVDRSRGGRRRWCSAARCGNRARVAAHRARHGSARTAERHGRGGAEA